jgi:glycosyltransferase involved in cell wall biosynthesis
LRTIDADLDIVKKYKDGTMNILMVGRLAPNKNHMALIESFRVYHKEYNTNSRLFIVGGEDPRLKTYTLNLRNIVRDLDLEERIIFIGKASEPVLKAYYLISHVFMMTSQHEGFCVPLVEAMSMKIPIVAYGSTAVPETVGKAGFVWEECHPDLMAASVDKIIREEPLRIALGEMGWNRYFNQFANNKIKTIFIESLKSLL